MIQTLTSFNAKSSALEPVVNVWDDISRTRNIDLRNISDPRVFNMLSSKPRWKVQSSIDLNVSHRRLVAQMHDARKTMNDQSVSEVDHKMAADVGCWSATHVWDESSGRSPRTARLICLPLFWQFNHGWFASRAVPRNVTFRSRTTDTFLLFFLSLFFVLVAVRFSAVRWPPAAVCALHVSRVDEINSKSTRRGLFVRTAGLARWHHHGLPDAGDPPAGRLGLADRRLVLRPPPRPLLQHLPLLRLDVPCPAAFPRPLGEHLGPQTFSSPRIEVAPLLIHTITLTWFHFYFLVKETRNVMGNLVEYVWNNKVPFGGWIWSPLETRDNLITVNIFIFLRETVLKTYSILLDD